MGRRYTNEWYKSMKAHYDENLRQQRIARLNTLIGRAMAEAAMGGFRGGIQADIIRADSVAEWRAELAKLTTENH